MKEILDQASIIGLLMAHAHETGNRKMIDFFKCDLTEKDWEDAQDDMLLVQFKDGKVHKL